MDLGPREGIDLFQVEQDDFGDFVKKMNALEKLKSLNIAGNPVLDNHCARFKRKIIERLPDLDFFNGDSRKLMKEQLKLEEDSGVLSDCGHSHDEDAKG